MVTSVNPSSLKVSWQCHGVITGYVIEYTRVLGSSDMMTVTSGTTRTITGLDPFVKYSVTVAAMTVNGTGPPSYPKVQTSGQDSKLHRWYSLLVLLLISQYPVYQDP